MTESKSLYTQPSSKDGAPLNENIIVNIIYKTGTSGEHVNFKHQVGGIPPSIEVVQLKQILFSKIPELLQNGKLTPEMFNYKMNGSTLYSIHDNQTLEHIRKRRNIHSILHLEMTLVTTDFAADLNLSYIKTRNANLEDCKDSEEILISPRTISAYPQKHVRSNNSNNTPTNLGTVIVSTNKQVVKKKKKKDGFVMKANSNTVNSNNNAPNNNLVAHTARVTKNEQQQYNKNVVPIGGSMIVFSKGSPGAPGASGPTPMEKHKEERDRSYSKTSGDLFSSSNTNSTAPVPHTSPNSNNAGQKGSNLIETDRDRDEKVRGIVITLMHKRREVEEREKKVVVKEHDLERREKTVVSKERALQEREKALHDKEEELLRREKKLKDIAAAIKNHRELTKSSPLPNPSHTLGQSNNSSYDIL